MDGVKLYESKDAEEGQKRETESVGNPCVEALSRAEITGTYIMQCFFYGSTTNR